MVKTPRTRHSKTQREPVTIDLEPDQVKREEVDKSEPAKDAAATAAGPVKAEPAGGAARTPRAKAETVSKPDSAAGDKPSGFGRASTGEQPRAEAAAASAGTGAPKPSQTPNAPRGGGAGGMLGAGIAGGAVALALAAGLQWSGVLPGLKPEPRTADPAVETLRQQLAALENRLDEQQSRIETGGDGQADAALDEARQLANSLDGRVSELGAQLSALQEAVSSGSAGEGAGLEALAARVATLEEREGASGQGAANEAVSRQVSELQAGADKITAAADAAARSASDNAAAIADLRGEVDALKARLEEGGGASQVAQVIAATALKSAVERGASFSNELETYAAIASPGAVEALAPLRPYAEAGLPSRAALAIEAPKAASRIVAATDRAAAGDGGIIDNLLASARSLVVVRPVGEVEGSEPSAIAARMEAAVIANDYGKALAEYASLPEAGKEAAADFARKLEARQAVDAALDKALSDALKGA
ncbi:COG4223 family protein [Nitratireductor sp. ZSWI3]|uniref:COG4223 family protein n=1 Tax=Nitratireductor sp. ZSWI3 TaxID=2966359 RepID=UPI00214FCC7E|nr:phage tail protein [Nitratireductor sp. ZSWI3]MCR4267229.1 phage tail protein [Nitratireductor sp. ZSWI3]